MLFTHIREHIFYKMFNDTFLYICRQIYIMNIICTLLKSG